MAKKKMKKAAAKKKAPARRKKAAAAPKKVLTRKTTPPAIARAAARPEEKPMSNSEVQKMRDVLTVKRDELLAVVQRKKEQEMPIGEVEIGDEADIATRSVEKEMLFELTDSEKQTVDMIEAALRRMEKGVYGRCESCQRVIPRLRLEVMPWARYCIQCQSEMEVPSGE